MNQQLLCTFLVFCLFTTALSESLINRILDTKEKYRRMWETERSGEELGELPSSFEVALPSLDIQFEESNPDENDDMTLKRGRARNVDRLARMHGTAGIAGKRKRNSPVDFLPNYQILKNCSQLRQLIANAQQDVLLRHLDDVPNDASLRQFRTRESLTQSFRILCNLSSSSLLQPDLAFTFLERNRSFNWLLHTKSDTKVYKVNQLRGLLDSCSPGRTEVVITRKLVATGLGANLLFP